MFYEMKIKDSRTCEFMAINVPFTNFLKGSEGYYHFNKTFMVFDDDETAVAIIDASVFNIERIYKDESDFDEHLFVEGFKDTDALDIIRKLNAKNEKAFPGASCYINAFWVEPEYRNRGIATYLLDNIIELLENYINMPVNTVVICQNQIKVKPTLYGSFAKKEIETENAEMKKQILHILNKTGFKRFVGSEYFVKFKAQA